MGRFETDVRYRSARYRVSAENPDGVNRGVAAAEFDEVAIAERPPRAPLVDDGAVHRVKARLGRPAPWRTRAIRLIWRLYLKPFDGARPAPVHPPPSIAAARATPPPLTFRRATSIAAAAQRRAP